MKTRSTLAMGIALSLAVPASAIAEVTHQVAYEYDNLGRLITQRGNRGRITRYTYDNEDRVITVTDALNRKTTLNYDARGRVIRSVDPTGMPSSFVYDANDRPVSITDPRGKVTTYENDGFGQTWKQTSPDTGLTTAVYDAAGLITRMTRNSGALTTYSYDGLGRQTMATAGTSERRFVYDTCTHGKGRLCAAELREGGTLRDQASFAYTPQGGLTNRQDSGIDDAGQPYNTMVAYAYDGMGRVTGVNYPNGMSVGYGYHNGRMMAVNAVVNGITRLVASSMSYQPFGPVNAWTYGNGLEHVVHYDTDGRVYGLSAGTATELVHSLTYGHNAADEIIAITNGLDAGQNRNYQYDLLGRVANETAKGSQWQYDANGNRTRATEAGVLTTYVIDPANNRLLSRNSPSGTRGYGYDALGNRISESAPGVATTYTYDPFNRLRSAKVNGITSTYAVNALDQRVGKSTPAGRTRFVYADQNQLLAERGPDGWTNYVWFGNELVGVVKPDLQLRFVHNDHLGRPEAISNLSQQVVWRANNDTWGRTAKLDTIGGFNIGFPGQYFDAESGLWYNGYRYYDSPSGYTQADPIGLGGGSFSTYGYVGGNPIGRADPSGLVGLLISGNFDAGLFGPGAAGSSGFFIGNGGWGFISGGGGRAGTGVGAAASASVGVTAASKPSDLAGTSAAVGANANIPTPAVVEVSVGASVSNICNGCDRVYSLSIGPALKPVPFEIYTTVTTMSVDYAQEEDVGDAVVIVGGEEVSRESVKIERPAGGGGREGGGNRGRGPGRGGGPMGSGCYGECGGGKGPGTVHVGRPVIVTKQN